jgi:serine/alanine adding enzyme
VTLSISAERLAIRSHQEVGDWDAFVNTHPHGSILHTSSMIRSESLTKRHEPHAFAAVDRRGEICAMLVAVRTVTIGGLASNLTGRSILHAEPLWLDSELGREGIVNLIRHHDAAMKSCTIFAEVRPLYVSPSDFDPLLECGYERQGYWNYELALDGTEEEIFRRLGKKCRNNLRSSKRKGVQVREVDLKQNWPTVYRLFEESYSHAKVPIVDSSLFVASTDSFSTDNLKTFVAYYHDEPVAAGCFLNHKDRVLCWYAGTKRIPGVPAMASVFWEAIVRFSVMGYQIFDFAGGGWEGEEYGPGKFKAKFGGSKINLGRYRKVYSPWKMKAAVKGYESLRSWLSPRGDV